MGLILDSSVIIAAERRGETIEHLIERILRATGDQDAAHLEILNVFSRFSWMSEGSLNQTP